MTCFHPITAYRIFNESYGGYEYTHNPIKGKKKGGQEFQHPCGQCIGCRLSNALSWALRCHHEASFYDDNCFLTLTLNDEYLYTRPNPYSIQRRKHMLDNYGTEDEFSLFMKRLRKKYGAGIRFYMCGEYGEDADGHLGRPHYHAIIFNHQFHDKEKWKYNNGNWLYTSQDLHDLWTDSVSGIQMGYCYIGDVTIDSAGYCARYALKKITGRRAELSDPETGLKYYEKICHKTGQVYELIPEYTNMSRMPGIGRGWLEKYKEEVLYNDSVINKNYPVPIPRYYDKLLEEIDPHYLELNKFERFTRALEYADNNTPDRLIVREAVTKAKTNFLPRKEN